MGGPQRAGRGPEPWPALFYLPRLEPETAMTLVLLPGYSGPQLLGLRPGGGDTSDALLPETHVDVDPIAQGERELLIMVSSGQTQLKQLVAGVGFDLRGQHSRSRTPCLAGITSSLED